MGVADFNCIHNIHLKNMTFAIVMFLDENLYSDRCLQSVQFEKDCHGILAKQSIHVPPDI